MRDCCARPPSLWRRIRPRANKVGAGENLVHRRALNKFSLAVNQANRTKSFIARFTQIFRDDHFNIARGKGVEINYITNFKRNRFRKRIEQIEAIIFFEYGLIILNRSPIESALKSIEKF